MTPDHPVGVAARGRIGQSPEPAALGDAGDADWIPLDQRTAHLARALFADLDYVLGVDPNTLAAFCVRVLDRYDSLVHNHGTEDGPGLACGERMVNGRLRGWCMDADA